METGFLFERFLYGARFFFENQWISSGILMLDDHHVNIDGLLAHSVSISSSFQYRTFTILSQGNCYKYTPDATGSLLSFPLLTILCLRSRDLSSGSLNLLRLSSDLLSVRTLRSLLSNSKMSSIISCLFSIRILSCAVSARMFLAFNSK